jgi:hypothetical protein
MSEPKKNTIGVQVEMMVGIHDKLIELKTMMEVVSYAEVISRAIKLTIGKTLVLKESDGSETKIEII